MSVLMTMRLSGDAKAVEATDRAAMKKIADRAVEHGLIRHHFYGTEDEILVVDEWPDEASFHSFFQSQPDIGKFMAEAGVTSEPEITFYRKLELGDDIG